MESLQCALALILSEGFSIKPRRSREGLWFGRFGPDKTDKTNKNFLVLNR
jgi:hypothetical protein